MDIMTVASLSPSFRSGARNAHTCARSSIVSEEIEFYRRQEKLSRRQSHADVQNNQFYAGLSREKIIPCVPFDESVLELPSRQ